MSWVTCPHCGFTQLPAVECFKCHKRLDKRPSRDVVAPAAAPAPATPAARAPGITSKAARPYLILLGALALLVVSGVIVWSTRSPTPVAAAPDAAVTPAAWTLDLTGRWEGKVATTLPGTPPRPALREVFVETDRSGAIVSAGAILTDPGHGGAGAGYVTVPDGGRRVKEAAAAIAASPHGAPLSLDFVPLPPWMPARDRTWRAVEGARRTPEETSYLLLEAVEPKDVIQAGLNASGFLSWLYLAGDYAQGRGSDMLSRVIHPEPDTGLRGFRNVVWDLSGAADFVGMQVPATISQPAGTADRVVLRRR
jgi:hypothetical protein